MASSCVQLCLQCRRFYSKTVAHPWWYFTHLGHGTSATRLNIKKNIPNGSLVIRTNDTAIQARQMWKHQLFFYSDFTAKHLSTEEKTSKDIEELSGDLEETSELSALEEICDEEAVNIIVPSLIPPAASSLSAYVEHSETLRKLVQLGVNLWKLDQRPNVGSMLLRLDFNTDVTPRLLFLKEIGVENSRLGYMLTHNPFILTESLENLQIRVNYLKSKKFSSEAVASMVSKAPYLLNFSVKRLDNRLGFYQQQLKLSASHTRNIVTRLPRLLCGSLEPVKENLKVFELELGFKENEIQHIVIAVPKVLTANKRKLTQIFDFIHNTMKVPHHLLVKFPQVLNSKYLRIRERHLFLEYLGKAQYDPKLPNYITLDRLASLPDEMFCMELASTTVEDFYLFQKTL